MQRWTRPRGADWVRGSRRFIAVDRCFEDRTETHWPVITNRCGFAVLCLRLIGLHPSNAQRPVSWA